uniref:3'-phosphate/5'-hydroxy nucleic acid ligase n=1 Tax=Lygus hesperus TaxID=30085 RepID=A0A0A9WTW9_LYGHE
MHWCVREGYAWAEDIFQCEEEGALQNANPEKVSARAKKRGSSQLGTLGAGNHYCEIQVVDKIFDQSAASAMNLTPDQIVIMVHSGSRGLGHQIATDSILTIDSDTACTDTTSVPNRELSCTRIQSEAGQSYLQAMACAGNFAWANRTYLHHLIRQAFAQVFTTTPDDLDMHLVYDVSHNIAKVEQHTVDGYPRTLLVHRKGATRSFPPFHPAVPVRQCSRSLRSAAPTHVCVLLVFLPRLRMHVLHSSQVAYQSVGQPVLVGGSMGTNSFVMVGTDTAMAETFGTTCHGAGRAVSRHSSHSLVHHDELVQRLQGQGVTVCTACPKALVEEAPEVYKDVSEVVQVCHDAGLSKLVARTRPLVVIKG